MKKEKSMDIQIFLRGTNVKLVNAWKKEFNDYPNVKVLRGDIFGLKADAIISPANSFGFMDGGIDLLYSEYFGWDLQEALQEKIRNEYYGELPVGNAIIIETQNSDIKYLISCPTMRVPEDVSNTINAYLAFRAGLIETIKFNNNSLDKITSILCPGLGTGTGMLPETICAKQMKYAYDSVLSGKSRFPKDLSVAYNSHIRLKTNDI